MEVKQLEHRPATVCTLQSRIDEVARLMEANNVGSVVVLDEHERLAGIVTDRDLVVRGLAAGATADTPVRDVMSTPVSYLFENADVYAATNEMAQKAFRRLPVLDAGGHLTGVVTFDDLVVQLGDELAQLARAVRKEIMAPSTG